MQEIIKAVQDIAIKISEVLKYGDLGSLLTISPSPSKALAS